MDLMIRMRISKFPYPHNLRKTVCFAVVACVKTFAMDGHAVNSSYSSCPAVVLVVCGGNLPLAYSPGAEY